MPCSLPIVRVGWGMKRTENYLDAGFALLRGIKRGRCGSTPAHGLGRFPARSRTLLPSAPGGTIMLAGPLRGHQLVDLLPANLNPPSQRHLKSRRCITPHQGHFRGVGAHEKWSGICRVARGVPTPGEVSVPSGYSQHGPGAGWSQGSGDAGNAEEGRGAVGRGWVCARLSQRGQDSANACSLVRPRGRDCSGKLAFWGELRRSGAGRSLEKPAPAELLL